MIVYAVDDDLDLTEGRELLFRQVGVESKSFERGQAFLDALPKLRPGCIFMDLVMPGMSGIELLERVRAAGCRWPVVIMTGHGSAVNAQEAIDAGALAFLEKPLREAETLAAVLKADAHLRGITEIDYDEAIARRIQSLSRRERQVFEFALKGLLNKQIGAKLGISESTVKSTCRTMIVRMRATNRSDLVVLALRGGVRIQTHS